MSGTTVDCAPVEGVRDNELERAEKRARRAEQAAEFRAAEAEQAEGRAQAAVASLGTSAGFVTRAGTYYDVRAAHRAAVSATEAAAAAVRAERDARALRAVQAEQAVQAAGATVQTEAAEQVAADVDEPSKPAQIEDSTSDDSPSTDDAAAVTEGLAALEDAADLDDSVEEGSYVDDITFSRQVARLTEAVARQPLHREILYKVLVFCQESRLLTDVENYVATLPAFKHAANNPYHFIQVLEQAGGLERFELDEEGEVVGPERKEGLTEDEIDDLVAGYAFMTTPAGLAVVEQHTPRARIVELLGLVPERRDAYVELLEFCSEEPRTYTEITQLLKGRPALVRLVDGEPQTMQPSVFVDKLEAAGGMEWRDGGWVLTDEGRAYLAELRG